MVFSTPRLTDDSNMLEVYIRVDDHDTFYQPWQTYQRDQRARQPLTEDICAENNTDLFDYHMRIAGKPGFGAVMAVLAD
jgi:hypothetical protein